MVRSHHTVSLAKHWLEMTLQSPERLAVGRVATGNQQQHSYGTGKPGPRRQPPSLFYERLMRARIFARASYDTEASSARRGPAAFTARLAPLSLFKSR